MRYPTENYQDVNTYVVDDLDVTVAGVGHNSGDAPSDIEILAADGWNIHKTETWETRVPGPAVAPRTGDLAIAMRNSMHIGFTHLASIGKADAPTLAVYELICFYSQTLEGYCNLSQASMGEEMSRADRVVRRSIKTLVDEGLVRYVDADEFTSVNKGAVRKLAAVIIDNEFTVTRKGKEATARLSEMFPLEMRKRLMASLRAGAISPAVDFRPSAPMNECVGVHHSTPDSPVQGTPRTHPSRVSLTPDSNDRGQRYTPDKMSPNPGLTEQGPRTRESDKEHLGKNTTDKLESLTSVESRGGVVGEGTPAVAGRSLAKGNELDLFEDPCRQPLAPAVEPIRQPCQQSAVEVIPLVAAVQLPVKASKRSVADRGPMKTPIDATWELNDAGRQYARDLGLSEEQIDDAAFSFVGWHNENSHRREGRFKDWGRRWMDWARKQAGQHRDRGTLGATGKRVLPGRGAQADAGKFKLNAAGEKIAFADEFEVVRLAYGVSVTGDFISEWTAAAEANLGFKLPFGIVMSRCRALRMKYAGKSKDGDTEVNLDYFGKVFIREMQFCDEVLRLRGERTTRSWGEAEWLARMEKKTEPRPDSPPVLIKWDECELGPLPGTELCLMPRHLWKHPATVKLITKTIPFNPNLRGNEKIASTFYDAEIKAAYDAMRESYDKIERDRPMTFARR